VISRIKNHNLKNIEKIAPQDELKFIITRWFDINAFESDNNCIEDKVTGYKDKFIDNLNFNFYSNLLISQSIKNLKESELKKIKQPVLFFK
jgi:hypothetical protein